MVLLLLFSPLYRLCQSLLVRLLLLLLLLCPLLLHDGQAGLMPLDCSGDFGPDASLQSRGDDGDKVRGVLEW